MLGTGVGGGLELESLPKLITRSNSGFIVFESWYCELSFKLINE